VLGLIAGTSKVDPQGPGANRIREPPQCHGRGFRLRCGGDDPGASALLWDARVRHFHHGQNGEVCDMNSTRVFDFDPQEWLPRWLGVDDLSSGLTALVACVAKHSMLRPRDPFERRSAQIAQRKESLRRAALERNELHEFVVLPKRWIVERTLAWISRNRRLARDFERYARTVAAVVRLAMIGIMLRRLTRPSHST
jgi:transposase